MDICTIIAKNYVAQARVLARSFTEHHPGGRCFVLVIDDFDGYLDPASEPFSVLTTEQIGCDPFEEMALRYDVLELSTAVKPWLLAYLLNEGSPAITYLDPDIRIHSSLNDLDELARIHGVVLTPHNTTPLPDDGERPNQIDILLAGVYNLGYVSLGASTEIHMLLRWWRERLLTDCRVDPHKGYFVDQRWFDLAPGLVSDHLIVREPQYNVAYWNLHSRRLALDEASYTVDDVPLGFFHFSGFDPQVPDVLSRHQTRVSVARDPALERLCAEYAAEVLAAGYRVATAWSYTYDLLPSGVEFNRRLRRLYEIAHDLGEVEGSPYTVAGDASFMAWLGSPAPGAPPGVNRLLAELYGTRADLQDAFPEVSGGDHAAFLRWASESGVIDEPALAVLGGLQGAVDGSMLASPAAADGAREHELAVARNTPVSDIGADSAACAREAPALPWGVNVVGYFRSELGVGEAARQVVSALDAHGTPVLPVHGRTVPPNRQGHAFTHLDYTDARYPVNLICMNADVLGEFAAQAGSGFFSSRYSIGMWFWEVEQFPDIWVSAFDHVEELWLPTEHVVRAVSPVSSVPITKVTIPVEMPALVPASREELGLPEGFMFLFSFDYHSVFARKNPLAVIEAYIRNFEAGEGAVLVIKSINADSSADDHARLCQAGSDRPDVHVIDGYLSPEEKNLMVDACDCYVSLHRAEGFGLTMAEAMYLGKPVVATGYSGNLDFMKKDNSFLVDHKLAQIGAEAGPYPPEGRWAEPDIDHAGRLMRQVFDHPEMAAARGHRAAEDMRRTHSAKAAGEIMGRRLDFLRERNAERLSVMTGSVSLDALDEQMRAGPSTGARSRPGAPRMLARRMLLRAMRPFTAYQGGVDEEIRRSLHAAETRIQGLEVAATERHATLLAALRSESSSRKVWERISGLTRSSIALESATAGLQAAIGELPEVPQRLDELARSLQRLESEGHAIPFMEGSPFSEMKHPQCGLIQGYRGDSASQDGDTYRSFEDIFRGAESFIRDRQRVFLELLEDRAPVLDFGCGRGEFLDLLAERGLPYLGVDSDAGMVRRCREKGHTQVLEADGLTYLQTLEAGDLGAIFCAQVIEHLPYEVLLRLLVLAREKLNADGVFVAETVNPHCPSAMKTFWVDLTHQHPVFPEVALHLCRAAGFASAFIFHPNGTGDVARDRFTQGEYAIVAGGKSLFSANLSSDASGSHQSGGPGVDADDALGGHPTIESEASD